MNYIIYINGIRIQTPKLRIRRTLQVNDLANLRNRQSNFTSNIVVKKTAINKKAFKMLGELGSTSPIPYERIFAEMLSETGEQIIRNGWAIINNDTDEEINFSIYDGYISFWKAIENKTFNDLPLNELEHQFNLNEIINTWNNELPYKYLIADFGGLNEVGFFGQSNWNVDDQIPCVKFTWLWDKIFDSIGFNYTGSIFSNPDFTKRYMTYTDNIDFIDLEFDVEVTQSPIMNQAFSVLPVAFDNDFMQNDPPFNGSRVFKQNTVFRLTHQGFVATQGGIGEAVTYPFLRYEITDASDNVLESGFIVNTSIVLFALEGQKLNLDATTTNNEATYQVFNETSNYTNDLTTTIEFGASLEFNFLDSMANIQFRDFLTEVIVSYGLTGFTDTNTNTVDFLTLNEVMNLPVEDWSNNFIRRINSRYQYSNYARRNIFKYKYDVDFQIYDDGFVDINNENIDAERIEFESMFHAPERGLSLMGFINEVPRFRLYQRILERVNAGFDQVVSEKVGQGKIFTLFEEEKEETQLFSSQILGTQQQVNRYFIGKFEGLSFDDLIDKYYQPFKGILNPFQLITAEITMNKAEYTSYNQKKLRYIKQLGGTFLVNSLDFIDENTPVKVELIKLNK